MMEVGGLFFDFEAIRTDLTEMLRAGEEEIPAVERTHTALLLRLLSRVADVLLALCVLSFLVGVSRTLSFR